MRISTKKSLGVVLAVIVSAFAGGSASADVVYTYTGNHFTTAMGCRGPFTGIPGCTPTDTPTYTTSDFLSISLTLTAPLAANLNLASVLPEVVTYSYSDGFYSYDYSEFESAPPASAPYPFIGVQFSTDASGDITNWAVSLIAQATITGSGVLTDNTPTNISDEAFFGGLHCISCQAVNYNSPGTWRVPAPTIGAGMPGLVAACAGFLVWWGMRRPWRSRRRPLTSA